MNYWLEVSTEYRYKRKIDGKEGLIAPASNRYINMMKNVKPKDIILHYIINRGAIKEHGSSIIGISKVQDNLNEGESRIEIGLKETAYLPVIISIDEIKNIEDKSKEFQKLLRMSFLRYLTRLTANDVKKLMNINNKNLEFINKNNIEIV